MPNYLSRSSIALMILLMLTTMVSVLSLCQPHHKVVRLQASNQSRNWTNPMRICWPPTETRFKMRWWPRRICFARKTWALPLAVAHLAARRVAHRGWTRRSFCNSSINSILSNKTRLSFRIFQSNSPHIPCRIRLTCQLRARVRCTIWRTWISS